MRDQLELLKSLNDIDKRALKIEEEINNIPVLIEKIEKSLQDEKGIIDELKLSLENYEKEKRDKDDELSVNSENLSRFNSRLREVKTNAEYHASLKEVDQAKKQMKALEEEILSLMETIEEENKKISDADSEFETKSTESENKKKEMLDKKKEAEAELAKTQKERNEKKKAIDPTALEIYESMKAKVKGTLLVTTNNGSCGGCHMHIPPQLLNDAMRHEKIYQCPHCHRILVVD